MQLVALIWGMLAMAGLGFAMIPCFGWLNWINIPFAVVGLIIGIISVGNAPMGQRGSGTAGIVLNAIAIVFGMLRLVLGGFVL
jgi:hypothetical protein